MEARELKKKGTKIGSKSFHDTKKDSPIQGRILYVKSSMYVSLFQSTSLLLCLSPTAGKKLSVNSAIHYISIIYRYLLTIDIPVFDISSLV